VIGARLVPTAAHLGVISALGLCHQRIMYLLDVADTAITPVERKGMLSSF
jgi:hypothetical protein